jgi:Trypsin
LFQANRFFIRAGSTYKKSGGTTYNVSNVYVHPKFSAGANRRHHDVGLLELTDNIKLSDSSKLVKLVHKGTDVKVGTDGIVSGWGKN